MRHLHSQLSGKKRETKIHFCQDTGNAEEAQGAKLQVGQVRVFYQNILFCIYLIFLR
jgi:hypothetical protein